MKRIISFEEKIDYIFNEMKAQKRAKMFKMLLKLAILGGIIVLINSMDKNEIIDGTTKVVGNIVKPLAQDIINDMVESSTNKIDVNINTGGLMHAIEKNPTILDNFKK